MSGPVEGSARRFNVSVLTNTDPGAKLCKVYTYDDVTGHTSSKTAAFLTNGRVKEHTFGSVRQFMDFRARLETNQALMMGKPLYSEARIVTQDALARISPESQRVERVIARDQAHVFWPDGPTLVMLDLDNPDGFPDSLQSRMPNSADSWRELLIECLPELSAVEMGWAPSSSSCIYLGAREVHGLRGQRFYFVIESGQDIPRFESALHDALVLRRLVWYEVSRGPGRLLKRLPFDLAVYRPEHLDFAAGPECTPPLEWRPLSPRVWNSDGPFLDAITLSSTREAQRHQINATLAEARRAKREVARARRESWKAETGQRIAVRSTKGLAKGKAVAEVAVELGVLLPEFLLTDSQGELISVGELLQDPSKHHGRRFHDPLEPDYRHDPRIAVFLVGDNGQPRIYSHAHGGQLWRCEQSIPIVRLGLIHETVGAISRALEQDDCGLFRSGDVLASVNEEEGRIHPLDAEGLGLRLQRRIRVVQRNTKGTQVAKDLPPRVLNALLSDASALPVRRLNAVVRGPYALADGTIVDTPGYDQRSQVLYATASQYPPRVRTNLELADAQEALRRLWHPVQLFPLKSNVDRGVLLAALLSGVIRPSIATAPSYYVTSHSAGTGKTLLAQTIGSLQTGRTVAATPLPRDEEERRKHLFASLRQGCSFLLYDNAERGTLVDSAVLANLITSPLIEGRVLGASNVECWPNRMTIALTGNNLSLSGDLNRRMLPIRLDASVEHPWQRVFPFHPTNYVQANWMSLRIHALELLQAWRYHGAPRAPGATGFLEWDATVRSVVVWASNQLDIGLGFADPAEALQASYLEDPETDQLANLLEAWFAAFGMREVLVKDVDEFVQAAELNSLAVGQGDGVGAQSPAGALAEARRAVLEAAGAWGRDERLKFGKYLAHHEGRVVRGLRLVKGSTRGGSRKYRVSRVVVSDKPLTAVQPQREVVAR